MRLIEDTKLDYCDVLLVPKRSTLASRRDVDLIREIKFPHSSFIFKGIPIIASNMDGVGTFTMSNVLTSYQMLTAIRKHYTHKDWAKIADDKTVDFNYVALSIGTDAIWDNKAHDYNLALSLIKGMLLPIVYICVDVANGYQENFVEFIKRVRTDFPDQVIIAGNVITPQMVEELIISGADIVKCGIGPGAVCTTRIKAGVGYPQFSGVIECADAAHGVGGTIIADGGCTSPGDIAKAFGAGADFVMLGSMLAGFKQSEQQVKEGKIQFYGMSSDVAVTKHGSRKDGYRSAEGRVVEIPFRGSVEKQIEDIIGGLRSACTYIGAKRLKDMSRCATFVKVNRTINTWLEAYDTGET